MTNDNFWQEILNGEQRLIERSLRQLPGADTRGLPDLLVEVIGLLLKGDLDSASTRLDQWEPTSFRHCRQVLDFWLSAEIGEPQPVFEQLSDWIAKSAGLEREKSVDARLAWRWAPILRIHLAGTLPDWPEDLQQMVHSDFERAKDLGLSDLVLERLRTSFQLNAASRLGDLTLALEVGAKWSELCRIEPEYGRGTEFTLEIAVLLELNDRLKEALKWLEQALDLAPCDYDFLLLKARVLLKLDDWHNSLIVCDRLISLFKESATGFAMRATVRLLADDLAGAASDADKACQLAPDNPANLTMRAVVALHANQPLKALTDFRLALALDPDAYEALRGVGKCLVFLQRDREALVHLNELKRRFPDDAGIFYELADFLYDSGYLYDSEAYARRCLQLDEEHANAFVLLAMIAIQREEDDLAYGLLERAISLEPDNAFALNEIAYLTYLSGEYENALELVEQALDYIPDFADAWCNQGLIYYSLTELEKAEFAFREATRLASDHATAWVGLGDVLTQQSAFSEALDCYDKALLYDPQSVEACHGMALLYRLLGLEDDVRVWQEKALLLELESDEL